MTVQSDQDQLFVDAALARDDPYRRERWTEAGQGVVAFVEREDGRDGRVHDHRAHERGHARLDVAGATTGSPARISALKRGAARV